MQDISNLLLRSGHTLMASSRVSCRFPFAMGLADILVIDRIEKRQGLSGGARRVNEINAMDNSSVIDGLAT